LIIILNIIDISSHLLYFVLMYICICNNITSKKVEEALDNGVEKTKHIYSYHKCKPKCGKCISFMEDIVINKTATVG